MESSQIALNIYTPFCRLPSVFTSDLFDIQGEWDSHEMTEHIYKNTNRLFFLKHRQIDEIPKLLGEQGTFYLHRVILSYLDAAHMLNDFANKYIDNIKDNKLSFEDIQKQAAKYNISDFYYDTVDATTYLCRYYPTLNREENNSDIIKSEILESLLAMNLNEILKNHGVDPYVYNNPISISINDYDSLILKMATNPEIGMVMHHWRKLNNYSDIHFISTTSKILEFIGADLKKNKRRFNDSSDYYNLVHLIDIVSNPKKQRNFYFGLFNEAERLGFISRHGTSTDKKKLNEERHLLIYQSLSTSTTLDIGELRKRMFEEKILPNGGELNYLYDVWHYTTSLIVLLWFKTRKTK